LKLGHSSDEPSKKLEWSREQAAYFLPTSFWCLVSTLKMEEICFSETPLTFGGIHGVISQTLNFSRRKMMSRHVARMGHKND
jgi:hypothetical protein